MPWNSSPSGTRPISFCSPNRLIVTIILHITRVLTLLGFKQSKPKALASPLLSGLADAHRGGLLDNVAAVGALAAVLGALAQAGGGPLRLVGYSLGGRLALQLAAAHPALFSRVVIVSGSAGLPGEWPNL